MRVGILVAALLWPGMAQADGQMPAFEFRGLTAGEPVDIKKLKGCKVAEVTACWETKVPFAGKTAFMVKTSIYRGMLSLIDVMLRREDAPAALDALKAKYGSPCRVEGPTYRPVYSWCFSSGTLWYHQDYAPGVTAIKYEDRNKPPAPAPKVDF